MKIGPLQINTIVKLILFSLPLESENLNKVNKVQYNIQKPC